jgi:hypothetical protein
MRRNVWSNLRRIWSGGGVAHLANAIGNTLHTVGPMSPEVLYFQALIIVWPKTMLYGRDIDCNLLFCQGYYTNAEPSGPNDDRGLLPY